MSKYKISLIVFSLLILLGIGLNMLWLIAGTIILAVVVFSIGSFFIGWNFYIESINKTVTVEKVITLSFDDGPSEIVTPRILDILKKYNCQGIFFCIGNKINGNENIVKRIVEEGHLIGNHSYSHSLWFDLYSSSRMYKELRDTNEEIYNVTGLKCKLFRPPYGVTNPMLAKAIKQAGFLSIGWNRRSLDTVLKDVEKVVDRISGKMQGGDIILLHDRMLHTPEILENFLQLIQKSEFNVERLDKIMEIECYEK